MNEYELRRLIDDIERGIVDLDDLDIQGDDYLSNFSNLLAALRELQTRRQKAGDPDGLDPEGMTDLKGAESPIKAGILCDIDL